MRIARHFIMLMETKKNRKERNKLFKSFSERTFCAAFVFLLLPISVWAKKAPAPIEGSQIESITVGAAFADKIERTFQKKCAPTYIGCVLTEADLDPRGSSSNILIFRGENRAYKTPVTSSLYRWMIGTADLVHALNDVQVASEMVYSFMRNDLGPQNEFDSASRTFDRASSAPRAKLRVLSSNHLSLEGLKIVNTNSEQRFVFDPFVSFSLNPLIALQYTRVRGMVNPEGRLYVASVPSEKFVSLRGSVCDEEVPLDPSMIYDINKCAHGDDASDSEGERDAAFYLPAEYLRWVIQFDR